MRRQKMHPDQCEHCGAWFPEERVATQDEMLNAICDVGDSLEAAGLERLDPSIHSIHECVTRLCRAVRALVEKTDP
jgi:hypothetical protein